MVLIALVGPLQAGKHAIAEYLERTHGFKALQLGADRCWRGCAGHDMRFDAVDQMLEYVMSEERWRQDYVICGVSTEEEVQTLRKRPFFLLVSVDAPVTMRFNRQQQLQCAYTIDNISEFIHVDDQRTYGLPSMQCSVFNQSDVHIVNCSSHLDSLHAALAKADIVNDERFRPGWDTYFIHLADLAAQRSNCMKRRVGCILTKNHRILSTGYNGTPRGITNCIDGGCRRCNGNTRSGVALDECLCLHAEENALLEAGRGRMDGDTDKLVLYCDTCPCLGCAKKIVQCGVQEVVYQREYNMDQAAKKLFEYAQVKLHKHAPVGLGRQTYCVTDGAKIDMQIEMERAHRKALQNSNTLTEMSAKTASFDRDIYGTSDKSEYATELPGGNDQDDMDDNADAGDTYTAKSRRLQSYTAPKALLRELEASGEDFDPMAGVTESRRIADRESDYHAQRRKRQLSPDRADAFGDGAKGNGEARSYAEVMRQAELEREEHRIRKAIEEKKRAAAEGEEREGEPKRNSRWDQTPVRPSASEWEKDDAEQPQKPRSSRWDETPRVAQSEEPAKPRSRWDETPRAPADDAEPTRKRSRWDQTPVASSSSSAWEQTPRAGTAVGDTPRKRSRWDETPVHNSQMGATPLAGMGMVTPLPGGVSIPMTPGGTAMSEIDIRNRFLSDEELDAMLPAQGYKIMEPPAGYAPIRTPARKLMQTPTPMAGGFMMQDDMIAPKAADLGATEIPGVGQLPFFKQEDAQFFGKLMDDKDESTLSIDELKERKIMRLLLKVKNGTPPMRKAALRQITDKAREFGPGPLFNQVLPLLMSQTLEDQERHLLVKVVDRILYKLDDLVRPYVHKILVVIEPLLIDEDYYARVEGREIISNLSKAAGLATMIATLRPDIDHVDEYVRNTTARAFSVVASALGVPALLPFLKAVCRSKKSWQARHTGIKIIQQIAILLGCAVLPHLKNLVEALAHGLEDEQQKVRTITALAIAALAEAAHPYGIESFDEIIVPLWMGVQKHRGKGLAAFLKAIGYLIPLMESEAANYYTREVMKVVVREFQSPDEEMKKIVLKVVKQCSGTEGIDANYIREELLPEFFRNFWIRRMALDRRNYKQVVETTVELAKKVGVPDIVGRIVNDLKDESEPYRKMVMETVDQIAQTLGTAGIDERLEEVLIDGILYAFQEQTIEDVVMLNGFGSIVNSLGARARPYLSQISSTILFRLQNKSAKVRQQSADLISRIAVVMRNCGEEKLMAHLGLVLYEYLGEEYPEVLGSILGALKAIVNVIGMVNMNPPIKDLLPRLTPILRNRHEKVQENCIAIGTLVAMADGTSRPIESLVPGDRVASPRVAADGAVVADADKLCTRVLDNGERPCIALTFEDGRELVCTPDHRLLCASGKWQAADELVMGERVAASCHVGPETSIAQPSPAHCVLIPVVSLRVVGKRDVGTRRVFDLTVPGNDAFFAGGVAVHNCIDLVGRIADRGAEFVSAREWMRICFELLDMLKAHKRGIRRAAVNTFGYISKAIGPQDVLTTLLNNLKVQERQNRVCTTVAIAIVAETCSPFTVLPALMNEYRVPELNVQNGVLKSLSFMFEYIGELGKDYTYAIAPLLEDALIDRDLVHRQTACSTVKHIALGVAGLGCEDAMIHLLNHVWPNIFETSPHVINAVMDAIDGLRVALGPGVLLNYVMQGMFHPARRVREVYWKIYNNMYIGMQDGIVPFYPTIDDDERNRYARHELFSDHELTEAEISRLSRINGRRSNRTSAHIAAFLRILVVVKPCNVRLALTVDSGKTIEYLASLIEADYLFTQSEKVLKASNEKNNETGQSFEPLSVGLLTDAEGVAYMFGDTIADVLAMGDTVHAVNSYVDSKALRVSSREHMHTVDEADGVSVSKSAFDLLDVAADETGEARCTVGRSEAACDSRFQSLLHNQVGLQLLCQFCIKQRCVENLLFWIDVEILRSAPPELQWLLSKYILNIYIDKKAPLKVNVSEEVASDISVASISLGGLSFVSIFDEAQESVYWALKNQALGPFEGSQGFADFLTFRRQNRQAYYASKIRSFSATFKPDLELMLQVCGEAEIQSIVRFNYTQKERYLNRLLGRYFPTVPLAEHYFDSATQPAKGERLRKGQKEKKLSKFFGAEDASQKGSLMDEVQRQVSAMVSADKAGRYVGPVAGVDDVSSSKAESDNEMLTVDEPGAANKRRKAGKLEGFFGDKISTDQLYQQKLTSMDAVSDTNLLSVETTSRAGGPPSMPAVPIITSNELDSRDKMALAKRAKKLKNMFGEVFDEDSTYQQFTKNAFRGGQTTFKRSTSALTDELATTAPLSPGGDVPPAKSRPTSVMTFEWESRSGRRPSHDADYDTDQDELSGGSDSSSKDKVNAASDSSDDDSDQAALGQSKGNHLRRREKLGALFGEKNIPSESITSTTPKAVRDHQANVQNQQVQQMPPETREVSRARGVKRVNKICKLLGELPPSEMLSETERRTAAHLQSIASISMMLSRDETVMELVGYLSLQELPTPPNNPNPGLAPSTAARRVSQPAIQPPSSPPPESPTHSEVSSIYTSLPRRPSHSKDARRKKMNKLQKFFGDLIDPAALIEQNIIDKLEREIERDLEGNEPSIKILKQDLNALRRQVRDVTEHIRTTLSRVADEEEDGDDGEEEEGVPPSAGQNSSGALVRPVDHEDVDPVTSSASGGGLYDPRSRTHSNTSRLIQSPPKSDSSRGVSPGRLMTSLSTSLSGSPDKSRAAP
ncbi:hypothetical protein RI367_002775 [Sorochytrium milnesiophthora]